MQRFERKTVRLSMQRSVLDYANARGKNGLKTGAWHGTHTVINMAAVSVASEGETLPELAERLTSKVKAKIVTLQEWVRHIEPLETLGRANEMWLRLDCLCIL